MALCLVAFRFGCAPLGGAALGGALLGGALLGCAPYDGAPYDGAPYDGALLGGAALWLRSAWWCSAWWCCAPLGGALFWVVFLPFSTLSLPFCYSLLSLLCAGIKNSTRTRKGVRECLGGVTTTTATTTTTTTATAKRDARHQAVTLLRHVSFLLPLPRCSAPLSPPPSTRRAFQAALPAVTNKKSSTPERCCSLLCVVLQL